MIVKLKYFESDMFVKPIFPLVWYDCQTKIFCVYQDRQTHIKVHYINTNKKLFEIIFIIYNIKGIEILRILCVTTDAMKSYTYLRTDAKQIHRETRIQVHHQTKVILYKFLLHL